MKEMKRIFKYFSLALIAAASVSCFKDNVLPMPVMGNGVIMLDISTKPHTRLTEADLASVGAEAYVNYVDMFICDGSAVAYYERMFYSSPAQPDTKTLGKNKNEFLSDKAYDIYVIANSTASTDEMEAITDIDGLEALSQIDEFVHFTGLNGENIPKNFLMYAKLSDFVLNPVGQESENKTIDVLLTRVVAKVVVELFEGDDVEFQSPDNKHVYHYRNIPYSTSVLPGNTGFATAVRLTMPHQVNDYVRWNPEALDDDPNVSITGYVYEYNYASKPLDEHTSLVVNIPLKMMEGSEVKDYPVNYYKIPLTNQLKFERNKMYRIRAKVNAPGAQSSFDPIELMELQYNVIDWNVYGPSIEVGGEVNKPKYLQLNTDLVEMRNVSIDESTLQFASSSVITSIELVSESTAGYGSYTETASTAMLGYYVDKFGQPQQVDNSIRNQIETDWNKTSISGGISVSSPKPVNDTPRYMTFEVTNADGLKVYFTVVQYPVIYITNIEGYYSYRDDFKASNGSTVHFENRTAPYLNTAYWANSAIYRRSGSGYNASWTKVSGSDVTGVSIYGNQNDYYDGDGNQLTDAGWNDNRGDAYREYTDGGDTYRIYYSNINQIFNSDVTREVYTTGGNAGKADLDTYYNSNNTWRYSNSKDPGNQRRYHVHLTATSSEYTIARPKIVDADGNVTTDVENGQTDDSADNALLVSPSFMIASQLGVTSSVNNSSETNYQRALNQCKNYVETYRDENGLVVHLKDWRLPTQAEIRIIADLQEKTNGAVDIVLAGDYYFCASPDRYTSGAGTDATGYFIRCIRDVY